VLLRLVVALLLACVCLTARTPTEYEIKAAFVYNFLRFTTWPSEAGNGSAALHLCVLGRDPFGEAIDAISGKPVQGRELRIRRLNAISQVAGCHAIFIAASEDARLGAILAQLSAQPVLTLSDSERFAERGGMIGLTLVDERVRFEVNLAAVRAGRLTISSQVLKLAQRVFDARTIP
jgi:YfiR/HmsC-like